MKRIAIILFLLGFALLNAAVITAWDFESQTTDPSTGSGTISLIGGVTNDGFNTGYPTSGYAWSTTTYPAQGTNNRSAGVYFEVSTVGFTAINISWAIRHSNTSANREVLYYTLDKTSTTPVWTEAGVYTVTGGDAWFAYSFNAASITEMNGNANLAFKLVSSFANTANDAYMPSKSTSTYAPSGKWRYDAITVEGTPAVPFYAVNAALNPFYAAAGNISPIQTYNVTGSNLTAHLYITAPQYFMLRIEGDAFFSGTLNLIPRNGIVNKNIQVVFQPVVSGVFADSITHTCVGAATQYLNVYGSTILPEPSNYPTSLASTGTNYYETTLTWTDSVGAILPDGYLIKGSKESADAIVAPVDGVVEADKKLTKNVAYGVHTQLIYELNEAHTYYFKIYPYTNSATAIDYKTDGNVPLLAVTTASGPVGSTLNPGDLAFVEYSSDSPDHFAFVLLTDVLENTKINFSDKAWSGTAFMDTEETYEWRGVARPYLKGEVIHIEEGILHDNEGIYNPDFEGFSNSGDQIIAYQGYITDPVFIAAFSTTDWLSSGTPTTNSSYLPSALTLGVNALGFSTEIDDGYYSGTQSGSAITLRAAINDPANWTRNNSLSNLTFPSWNFQFLGLTTPVAVVNQSEGNYIDLSWAPVSGATYYKLYSSVTPDAAFPLNWTLLNGNLNQTTWTDSSAGEARLFYRVVAGN